LISFVFLILNSFLLLKTFDTDFCLSYILIDLAENKISQLI